jgi:putative membrane protein
MSAALPRNQALRLRRSHEGTALGNQPKRLVMIALVVHVLLYALSFMLAAKVVPGIAVRSYGSAVKFAVVFALLDGLFFKLLAFLTMPLVLLSLGLFLLIIRAALFFVADRFVDGVKIESFLAAFFGSLVTGGLNWLITRFVHIG